MKRHQFTDEQWALVESLAPPGRARTGRPSRDRRFFMLGLVLMRLRIPGRRIKGRGRVGRMLP